MDTKTRATLPKSRSNTRISVLTANYAAGAKPKYGMTSESTRLVYQHGQAPAKRSQSRSSLASSDSGSGLSNNTGRVIGLGGAARGYGCYEPLSQQSNPVNACLRAGVAGFGWCMVSWFIGVALLVIEYARIWGAQIGKRNSGMSSGIHYPRQATCPPWLIFAPFWLGDFLALVVLARVLSKIASVRLAAPTRHRGFRRSDGRERSSGSLNELSNGSNAVTVNMDYFPLLQRVVMTALGCFIVLLLVIVEQILACLRWGRATDAGVPGSLALAAPALVLEGLCLLRITLLKTQGLLSAITWGLLLLLTVSVSLRSGNESSFLHSYPWLECLTPLWMLDFLYLGVAAYVAANTCAGRFVMTPTQGVCFLLFVMALIGSTAAELLLTGDKRIADWTDKAIVSRSIYLRLDLPLLLALVSLLAFCLAVFLSAEHSISLLVSTHGNKGTSISSMDVGPSEDGCGGYRAYQRTDSGQYVDIYDKL